MIDYKLIQEAYPHAFKEMEQHFNDGIGSCGVRSDSGWYGNVLWWYGDSPDLDHRIDDYELYKFFDKNGIFVVVKIDSLSSRGGDFVFDVHAYNDGKWCGEVDQRAHVGSSRQVCQDDAFDLAFEILNDRLMFKKSENERLGSNDSI